ncbi:right-handed parallel beta-helix repeat-containing protein [bacterium]|nr:right-handed parallel beta-helix repeat-containing protein [bacterium]
MLRKSLFVLFFTFLPILLLAQQTGILNFIDAEGEILERILPTGMDSLRLALRDIDRNLDFEAIDQVEVEIYSEGDEELEIVTLVESGVNTGTFRGAIVINGTQFQLEHPDEELIQKHLDKLIQSHTDPLQEQQLDDLYRDAEKLAWQELGIRPIMPVDELDEEGVLEVLTGQQVYCTYSDPRNNIRLQESIEIFATVGGIAGEVSGIWDEVDEFYTFIGDAYIPENDTLLITAGMQVRFLDAFTLVMGSGSRLLFEGDADNQITMTRAASFTDTTRNGFRIIGNENSKVNLQHSVFSFLNRIDVDSAEISSFEYTRNADGIYSDWCHVEDSFFHDNVDSRSISSGESTIMNSVFDSNGSGITVEDGVHLITNCEFRGNFTGIYAGYYDRIDSIQITDCIFVQNTRAMWFNDAYRYYSIQANNCVITDNENGIIIGPSVDLTLRNNTFENNLTYDIEVESDVVVDAQFNDWGAEHTQLIEAGDNPRNLLFFYDSFDDEDRGEIIYANHIGTEEYYFNPEFVYLDADGNIFEERLNSILDSVYIMVIDPDRNLDPELFETVEVELFCETEQDQEFLTLTETEADNGIFYGAIVIDPQELTLVRPDEHEVEREFMNLTKELSVLNSRDSLYLRNQAYQEVFSRMHEYSPIYQYTDELDEEGVLEISFLDTLEVRYADLHDRYGNPQDFISRIPFGGISGIVSGVWTAEHNPYIIADYTIVPDGEELIVDPGVEIIFHGETAISNRGTLRLLGTQEDSIFISTQNIDDDFDNFYDVTEAEYVVFSDCNISNWGVESEEFRNCWFNNSGIWAFADIGSYDNCVFDSYDGTALYIRYSKTISNCVFSNLSVATGLSYAEEVSITNCEYHDNEKDIYFYLDKQKLDVTGCNFSNSTESAVRIVGFQQLRTILTSIKFRDCSFDSDGEFLIDNSSIAHLDMRFNHWSEDILQEMQNGEYPTNITRFTDGFDSTALGEIVYTGFDGDNHDVHYSAEFNFLVSDDRFQPISPPSISWVDTITFYLNDNDLNLDEDAIDTATIEVDSPSEETPEIVTLVESEEQPGFFEGFIALNTGAEEGNLEVADGEEITFSLVDEFDNWSNPQEITKSTVYFVGEPEDYILWRIEDSPVFVEEYDFFAIDSLVIHAGVDVILSEDEYNWSQRHVYVYGTQDQPIRFLLENTEHPTRITFNDCFIDHAIFESFQKVILYDAEVYNSSFSDIAEGTSCFGTMENCEATGTTDVNSYALEFGGRLSNTHVYDNRNGIRMNQGVMDSCLVENCTNGYYGHCVRSDTSNSIYKSSFLNNERAIYITSGGQETTYLFDKCRINGNETGIGIITEDVVLTINRSSLRDNSPYAFRVYNFENPTIDATHNYWGSSATEQMDENEELHNIGLITDYFDDPRKGLVNYYDYLQGELIGDPVHYNPVEETTYSSYLTVRDIQSTEELPANMEFAVFDGETCVGAGVFTDYIPFTIELCEQDDVLNLPGFTLGNEMDIRAWDPENNTEIDFTYIFERGDHTFRRNSMDEVVLLYGDQPQSTITLPPNYFELMSFNRELINPPVGSVFDYVESLVFVQNDLGNIYLPEFVNTIGQVNEKDAYKVLVQETENLTYFGESLRERAGYTVVEDRWNWIGYPHDFPCNAEIALEQERELIIIMMTDDGRVIIPEYNINTIGEFQPHEGYMIFVTDFVVLRYDLPEAGAELTSRPAQQTVRISDEVNKTGLPYAIMVEISEALQEKSPAYIELYDGSKLVGGGFLADQWETVLPLIAWEEATEYQLDGFTPGHPIQFVVRDAGGKKIPVKEVGGNKPLYGNGPYAVLSLDAVPLPTHFEVSPAYPNPFNSATVIPFTLPEGGEVKISVFNVLGQEILVESRRFDAGWHKYALDMGNTSVVNSTGLYFVRVGFGARAHIQKIVLVK